MNNLELKRRATNFLKNYSRFKFVSQLVKILKNVNTMFSRKKRTVNHFGVKLNISKGQMSEGMFSTIINGYYENEEAEGLPYIFQDDEIVLEIGGGIGFISAFSMKNPKVKEFHTYEANPDLIPLIKETHEINNVDANVYNMILAKKDGEIDFYINQDFWASSMIPHDCARVEKIKAVNFQTELERINPTLMIIDIEGGEISLFDEIQIPLSVTKIYMEIHQNVIGRDGVKKVFDQLSMQSFHYDVWHSNREVVLFSRTTRD